MSKFRAPTVLASQVTTTPGWPVSSQVTDTMKRLLDLVVGVAMLTACLPLFLVIAVVIRCSSRGGVFYKQERVGRGNRLFFIWKFRTMSAAADQGAPLVTACDDARTTPVGRYLRHKKLDELPQLWNVVRGDMSLVGPRPQVPRFVDAFPANQRALILSVRPGITGPTQLEFRDEEQRLQGQADRESYYIAHLLPAKCQMDVEYVRHRSVVYDLRILWATGKIVGLSRVCRFPKRNSPPLCEALGMNALPVTCAPPESLREDIEITPVQI